MQGVKVGLGINDQDWKFIKKSLKQSIAAHFITEAEKKEIMHFLKTTEEANSIVCGLMTASQSVTSFVLSLLQAAHAQQDCKK